MPDQLLTGSRAAPFGSAGTAVAVLAAALAGGVALAGCSTIPVPALPDPAGAGDVADAASPDLPSEATDPAGPDPRDAAGDPREDPVPPDAAADSPLPDVAPDLPLDLSPDSASDIPPEAEVPDAGGCTGDPDCDDDDPCTNDRCDGGSGQCRHEKGSGAACDDKNACTVGDECFAGSCVGKPNPCDDKNPCTKDICVQSIGCTAFEDDAASCDDLDPCTVNDHCKGGKCEGGAAVICNDGNPCTEDTCGPNGECVSVPSTGGECSDSDPCTEGEACEAGACRGGTHVTCDDGDSCTVDGCDPTQGCVHDLMIGCKPCLTDQDCGLPPACMAIACDSAGTQTCLAAPTDGVPCEDGNPCTVGDRCAGGSCVGGLAPDCEDGNPCTADSCSIASGGCEHVSREGACDDGDACTGGDSCKGGACVPGAAVACDDGNACTNDGCDPVTGLCAFSDNNAPCDDGQKCTQGDVCANRSCAGKPVSCDDGDACTKDSCDPGAGCVHAVISSCMSCVEHWECDDGDPCTADACVGDQCRFPAGNDGQGCDDGNACTVDDWCDAGECLGGYPRDCSDQNPCTDDSCDVAVGCRNVNNTFPCSDGNPCTWGDRCGSGYCKPGSVNCDDGNACTDDFCSYDGTCPAVAPMGAQAGASAVPGTRAAGARAGGAPTPVCCHAQRSCDDGNPCTDDSCDRIVGCRHAPNSAPCQAGRCDGMTWYKPTYCEQGACPATQPSQVCSDNLSCTMDTCGPTAGCGYVSKCTDPKNPVCTPQGCACGLSGSKCGIGADECVDGICMCAGGPACSGVKVCCDGFCYPGGGCP